MHIWYDMMSLLAMPTPSKSTYFTIHVYCRDKQKWLTRMYCIKTKTSYCIQQKHISSTHYLFIVQLGGMFTTDGRSGLMFCPNIYNYFVVKSSMWSVDEISAGVSFGLISTGYKTTDTRSTSLYVCMCAGTNYFFFSPNNVCHKTLDFRDFTLQYTDIIFHLRSLACSKKANNVTGQR